MPKLIDLTGRRFGRLVVISYYGPDKRGKARWNCRCDCGRTTVTYGQALMRGTTSCGCERIEKMVSRSTTHGAAKTRLYQIWNDIKSRTGNPNNKRYNRYGGRGIELCKEWENFETFQQWALENGYREDLTIDRIDNNKGYSPKNCRWTTKAQQNRNKGDNIILEYNGQRKILADWAKEKGLTYACLKNRIKRGWTTEQAIETPPQNKNCPLLPEKK